MRIESTATKAIYNDATVSKHNAVNFEATLSAASRQRTNIESDDNYDVKTMSINEIVELETKAATAFKQGDLIGYQHYTKTLNDWKQTINDSVQQLSISTVEEVSNTIEHESPQQGLFPEDAPQSLKDYESKLSLRGKINLMMAVSVQKIIANAYQDSSGGWQIRRQGQPGYVDIFKQPDFSYTKLAEDMLAYMQFERTFLRPDEFKEKEETLNGFKTAVEGY